MHYGFEMNDRVCTIENNTTRHGYVTWVSENSDSFGVQWDDDKHKIDFIGEQRAKSLMKMEPSEAEPRDASRPPFALRTGIKVETREGEIYTVFTDIAFDKDWLLDVGEDRDNNIFFINENGWLPLSDYNNELLIKDRDYYCGKFDIMKAWIPESPLSVRRLDPCEKIGKDWKQIWEREEKREIPIDEVLEILNDCCDCVKVTFENGKFYETDLKDVF